MTQFPIELKILIDAVHWQVHASDRPCFIGEFDEELLFNLAVRHSLLNWFLPYSNAFSIGSEELHNRVVSYLLKGGIKHQLQTLELLKLSLLFDGNGIKHVILKGVTIEKQFYRGFIDSRYSDDIDVLISPSDLAKASRLLMTEGYSQREPYDVTKLANFLEQHEAWFRWRDVGFKKQSIGQECIDLHWRIADEFTIPIKGKFLIEHPNMILVNGEYVPGLPFSTLFVYVCVHGYIDYFFRLRYLVDVYTAMQQSEFDFDEITKIAKEWGVFDKVLASMATAENFFSTNAKPFKEPLNTSGQAYASFVRQRFIDADGLPPRSHPNNAEWTSKDKLAHLMNQIKFRSDKSWFFEPLVSRFKYNHEMLALWSPSVGVITAYPMAMIKRFMSVLSDRNIK